MIGISGLLWLSFWGAPPQKATTGKLLLQRSCTACHNLDSITARRLSREDWSLELDKMVSMGAQVKNRKALLDYLSSAYGSR